MHADKLLGDLLAQIRTNGQYDHSIIVVVADHGVSLWPGERPRAPSEFRLPDVQAIPLIIKLPGKPAPEYRSTRAYRRHLYPTVLDHLGVTIPESLQGKSLVKIIHDAAPAETVKSTPHRDDPTLKAPPGMVWNGDIDGRPVRARHVRPLYGRRVDEFQFTRLPDATVHLFGTRFNRAGPQLSSRIDAQINGGAQKRRNPQHPGRAGGPNLRRNPDDGPRGERGGELVYARRRGGVR
jgi:arylsulfatase A-like enzyme